MNNCFAASEKEAPHHFARTPGIGIQIAPKPVMKVASIDDFPVAPTIPRHDELCDGRAPEEQTSLAKPFNHVLYNPRDGRSQNGLTHTDKGTLREAGEFERTKTCGNSANQ